MKDVFLQRVIFGTLLFLVCIIGFGIVSLKHIKSQAQNAVAETTTQVQSLKGNPPKTPPLGKTVSESGHWHGDEWHADPHEDVLPPIIEAGLSPAPSAGPTEGQSAQVAAQIPESSARIQESGKAVYGPKFAEWFKKDVELRTKRRQIQQKLADALSSIKADYQTDEQFKKALSRVLVETEVELGEAERQLRAHKENRPVAP